MKNTKIWGILFVLLVAGSNLGSLTMLTKGQDEEEELVRFSVEYNKKIYYGDSDTWNFTITNLNCTQENAEKASFFLKIYLTTNKTETLLWDEYNETDYHTWKLGIGETTTRNFTFPAWGEAKKHKIRTELYWLERSKPNPVAKRTRVVHVAKVFVLDWNPSTQIVSRDANKSSNLSISFRNGGNDRMYNTSITITDADGLQITPQLQNLGVIEAGENKAAIFYVNASQTEERRQIHNPRFEIIYYDFRGVAHTEEYTATVRVITNPFIYNIMRTLGAIALTIAIGAATLFVALVRKSKKHRFAA